MTEDSNQAERGNPDRISDAEHAVMEVLWADAPLTANAIAERVAAGRDWSLATVKTLLSRLVTKQAVATAPQGKRFLYTPLLERTDYLGGESKRLVERLFGGSAAGLFAHLAEAEALSDKDLVQIEALLKALKAEGGR
jgi:predicted transcriptional regulator